MHGAALLYEVGDDLDEDMVANYAANLEKVCSLCKCVVFTCHCVVNVVFFLFKSQVLSELPSPVTSGTTLTVEDLKQELTCNINIKHRFFFTIYKCLSICFISLMCYLMNFVYDFF